MCRDCSNLFTLHMPSSLDTGREEYHVKDTAIERNMRFL